MSYNSYAKKIDKNQPEIVEYLEEKGCKVQLDCNDILVSWCDKYDPFGWQYYLKWIEIKSSTPFKKDGTLKGNKFIKKAQYEILESWDDNYSICWTKKQAWNFVRGIDDDYITPSKYRANLLKWRPKMTPEEKAEIQLQHWGRCL